MTERKICIISLSPIAWDGRVLRQIEMASRSYLVHVIGYGKWTPQHSNVRYFDVGPKHSSPWTRYLQGLLLVSGNLFPLFWDLTYWSRTAHRRARKLLAGRHYDLIHANDLNSLPVAVFAKKEGTKLLFDAHEYSLGQRTDTFVGRLRGPYAYHMLSKYLNEIDAFVTVSDGVAELYKVALGLEASVVMNSPSYIQFDLRETSKDYIRLVHHGAAKSHRGISELLMAMLEIDEHYSLDFILLPEEVEDFIYLDRLKAMASEVAPGRITFRKPILPGEIIKQLHEYDVGVFAFPLDSLNHQMALPNKFFEFIMAGLAVAISPAKDVRDIVKKYEIGILLNDQHPRYLASSINQLTVEKINCFKQNSLTAARHLNAETQMARLKGVYNWLLENLSEEP